MECQITILVLVMSLVKVYCKDTYSDERSYFSSDFIGCFRDSGNRILPLKLKNKNTNTGKECKDRCKQYGYRYAGTEASIECFCGQQLKAINVSNKECNRPCHGNGSEHCGGIWYISVYDNEALITTSMPTSRRSSMSSSSEYYGKTASKVTFSTTSQQNIHAQPTTDKTTFSSTSVSTWTISSSAANPISASSSTSHKMSHSTNFTNKDISKNEWVRINAKLLLVVEQEESFSSARNTCMNMGAELLAYSNPMRFFQPSIDKTLKNNSYWLGVYTDKLDMECPILCNKNNVRSFQLTNCSNNNQFICSKSSNVTDEAESLEFEEMLKDMTVERLKTSKTKRKLVSARDKRKSSKSIGASGIFIICAVIAFFVLIDINWRQCHFVRRNT